MADDDIKPVGGIYPGRRLDPRQPRTPEREPEETGSKKKEEQPEDQDKEGGFKGQNIDGWA